MQLFAGAYPGVQATAFNGQEGTAFRDVLIDLLQADDDDGDITNGTPNGMAIVNGFAMHGITLISNAELLHQAIMEHAPEEEITLQAVVHLTFPFNTYLSGVRAFYRVNNSSEWESMLMTGTGGSNYSAVMPPQAPGTVVAYYMALEDINGQTSSVLPRGAAMQDPNIPNFIIVGAMVTATENGDDLHQLGPWQAGLPTDNATTGHWVWTVPIGSYSDVETLTGLVQPDHQHTPGGEFCWVTGNAASPTSPLGENDVDGGTTTLMSAPIDLAAYEEPIFTYWRWYVNNPPSGANPNADWWQVYISNDGGSNWVPVEDTKTSDRSWRRMAFRVRDHVEPTANMRIKFHASDSIRPGQNLDGGSLVEAAIDDIQLWDLEGSGIGIRENVALINALYPDPATDVLNVLMGVNEVKGLRFEIVDITGRVAMRPALTPAKQHTLDVSPLAGGQYVLRAIWENGHSERRFSVIR
jgi:hypothetical protein